MKKIKIGLFVLLMGASFFLMELDTSSNPISNLNKKALAFEDTQDCSKLCNKPYKYICAIFDTHACLGNSIIPV